MSYKKCPRCEINYIMNDKDKYCSICMEELGLHSHDEPDNYYYANGKNIGSITELKNGYSYGTVARDIYDKCCNSFCWKHSERGNFARQQKLYARNAAGEYSVWFLAHSNYTGDRSTQWTNTVYGDRIEEEYEYNNYYSNIGDVRITFAKRGNGDYMFLGVYQQDSKYRNDRGHIVMVYKKISDYYPM